MVEHSPPPTRPKAAQYLKSRWKKAADKILVPALSDATSDVVADDELVGEAGFCARVDHDRCFVNKMMPVYARLRRVDICRRFEPGPCSPQKVRRRPCHSRVIMQNDQRPVLKRWIARDSRRQRLVFCKRSPLQHQTSTTKHFSTRNSVRQLSFKLTRQFANRIAQPEHDRFTALVYFPTRVIEGVHRNI